MKRSQQLLHPFRYVGVLQRNSEMIKSNLPVSVVQYSRGLKRERLAARAFSIETSHPSIPQFRQTLQNSPTTPIAYTSTTMDTSRLATSQIIQRQDIEDGVMGILTRYTAKSIQHLELTTRLEELETRTGHDSSHGQFFSTEEPAPDTNNRRMWDCLDTVEFMLDVEKLFQVEISDSIADCVETPEDAVNAVHNLLKKNGRMK